MLPSSMTVALFTHGKGEVKRNSLKICKHLKYFLCTRQSLWGTQKCIKVVLLLMETELLATGVPKNKESL